MKASFALLFLAVLGALLTLNWLHAGGDVSALSKVLDPVANETEASESEGVLVHLSEWLQGGVCDCFEGYDDPEDVPDSKYGEVIECCVKEYCMLHNRRYPAFCDCVARNYGW